VKTAYTCFNLLKKIFIAILIFSFFLPASSQNYFKIDSLKAARQQETEASIRINILFAITDQFINNTPDSALVYADKAYELAKDNELSKELAGSMNRLARIYRMKYDLKTAFKYATSAYDIALDNEYKVEMIGAMINTGFVFNSLGDYEKGSEYFFNSLKLSEEIEDKKLISQSLNSIGYSYYDQQNIDKALEYYLQSLDISREIRDKNGISAALNNVAAVYGEKGDLEELKSYVLEAIKINNEIGQLHYLTINYMNMGYYYIQKNNYDSSIYYNNVALEIAEKMNNIALAVQIKSNIARFLFWSGQTDASLIEAKLVLEEAEKHKLKKTIHSMADLIDQIYISQDNFREAYPYSTLKFEMKDTLDLDDKLTEISKLELLYEYEKEEQKQQIKEQRKELSFLIIAVVLLSLLGLLFSLLMRNRMKTKISELEKQKLEDELDFRNKELATNVMSLMKKNEMLSDFSVRLIQVEKEAEKDETKTAIRKISKELKNSVETEIWEEFELRFKEVHTEFYHKLMHDYPNLTPNEQRLSAFLRLNMSTKEISELTGQSISAIEMARFRLRKKLNISGTDENLITFLSQF
jgi:tetratricopeptide (TPR) repeat protein